MVLIPSGNSVRRPEDFIEIESDPELDAKIPLRGSLLSLRFDTLYLAQVSAIRASATWRCGREGEPARRSDAYARGMLTLSSLHSIGARRLRALLANR